MVGQGGSNNVTTRSNSKSQSKGHNEITSIPNLCSTKATSSTRWGSDKEVSIYNGLTYLEQAYKADGVNLQIGNYPLGEKIPLATAPIHKVGLSVCVLSSWYYRTEEEIFCFPTFERKFHVYIHAFRMAEPYCFCQLSEEISKILRTNLITHSIYIDDLLLISYQQEIMFNNVVKVLQIFKDLGVQVNIKKVEPLQTSITFLGWALSESGTIALDHAKKIKIVGLLQSIRKSKVVHIKRLAKMVGLVNFLCQIYKTLSGLLKIFLDKINQYSKVIGWNAIIKVDLLMKVELAKLEKTILQLHPSPSQLVSTCYVLIVDSSKVGWSGILLQPPCKKAVIFMGLWSLEDQRSHISCLELKAVLLTINKSQIATGYINIFTDNMTTKACLKRLWSGNPVKK